MASYARQTDVCPTPPLAPHDRGPLLEADEVDLSLGFSESELLAALAGVTPLRIAARFKTAQPFLVDVRRLRRIRAEARRPGALRVSLDVGV
jgi:hypothetical protein